MAITRSQLIAHDIASHYGIPHAPRLNVDVTASCKPAPGHAHARRLDVLNIETGAVGGGGKHVAPLLGQKFCPPSEVACGARVHHQTGTEHYYLQATERRLSPLGCLLLNQSHLFR